MIPRDTKTSGNFAQAIPTVFRYFMLGLFVVFAGFATYFAEEAFFPEKSSFSRNSIEHSIDSDLIQMREQNSAIFFHQLKKVYLSDHRTEKVPIDWSKIFSKHFEEKNDSKQILQIDLFDSSDGKNPKERNLLVVQYSLLDESTKNKLWEISRTYELPK